MLRVDLRALADGPVVSDVAVPPDASVFEDLDIALDSPVRVRGRLTESGPGRYYWHGTLHARLAGGCRRCLARVPVDVEADVRALFAEEPADDPAMYAIRPGSHELDLGPMVREELVLAAPTFVLCREDCLGLCAKCGSDLNEGPCACRPEPDPRWAALRALRQRESDDER
jgi:uncharacterized protein